MENKPHPLDYVAYDDIAKHQQSVFKDMCATLMSTADTLLSPSRYRSLFHTELEKAYMFLGKAIRDDQIARNGSAPLQEGRSDS